jgi:hypothetical protein
VFFQNRLLIIRDFQRLLSTSPNSTSPILRDITTEITFSRDGDPDLTISYFTFEHNRLAVISTSGVFIFTLDSTFVAQHGLQPRRPSRVWPNLRVSLVKPFYQKPSLESVSCVQMNETELFLAYDDISIGELVNKFWQVSFAPGGSRGRLV